MRLTKNSRKHVATGICLLPNTSNKRVYMYSRNCYLRPPLGAVKTMQSQNSKWSLKWGLLIHSPPCKSQWKHFLNIHNALAAVYTDILHLCGSKFKQKGVPSKPTQAYNKVHVYSTVVPYSRWMALCVQNRTVAGHVWQVVAHHRDFSVQNHPCMEFRS